MVEIFCREAAERVAELEEWGALFDRNKEGLIAQRNFGGHRYPRLAHVGDRTGLELIRTLQNHGIHQGLDIYMECCIVELLKEGDRVCGAFGFWRESGQFVVFRAKSVDTWQQAAWVRFFVLQVTPGKAPVTGMRWPTEQERN